MTSASDNCTMTCFICEKMLDNASDMELHMGMHYMQENSCPLCPMVMADTEELQKHVLVAHEEVLKTPQKYGSTSHTSETVTPEKELPSCSLCDKQFAAEVIASHVATHFVDSTPPVNCAKSVIVVKNEQTNSNNYCGNKLSVDKSEKSVPSCSYINQPPNLTDLDEAFAKQLDKEEVKQMHRVKMDRQKAEELQFEMLREAENFNPRGNFVSQSVRLMEKDIGRKKLSTSDYYRKKFDMLEKLEEGYDDCSTCTFNASVRLAKKLEKIQKAAFHQVLSAQVSHFGRGYGDTGWGCGYRNIQMMLSSLQNLPKYKDVLTVFKGNIPSIPELQRMIEDAWSKGFDENGRDQLGGNVVGTRKWIGATEVFTLLSSLNLHCRIIDFHRFSDQKSRNHPLLFDWVGDYFGSVSSANRVQQQVLPPLYLQHSGHSRSIVGVQYKNGNARPSHLIIFDPSHKRSEVESVLASQKHGSPFLFLKTLNSFSKPQYQVVGIIDVATEERYKMQKNVDILGERIPP